MKTPLVTFEAGVYSSHTSSHAVLCCHRSSKYAVFDSTACDCEQANRQLVCMYVRIGDVLDSPILTSIYNNRLFACSQSQAVLSNTGIVA